MNKSELRKAVRERSLALTTEYKDAASKIISKKIFESDYYIKADSIFVYVSTEDEPDTMEIIKKSLEMGKNVCVPKITGKGTMNAVKITSLDELETRCMGIAEPIDSTPFTAEFDVGIIPCVTASHDLKRLGHGGGFYDRFLAEHDMKKVCICFEKLINENIPNEEYDILMDEVITEA